MNKNAKTKGRLIPKNSNILSMVFNFKGANCIISYKARDSRG